MTASRRRLAPSGRSSGTLSVEGRVAAIVFRNAENDYTVARLDTDNDGKIVVAGHLPGVSSGETLRLRGRWKAHPRFGDRLEIEDFEVLLPADAEGIRTFLSGGALSGLGPKMAERLVAWFGADTIAVLDAGSARLQEVPGIGPKRAAAIAEIWAAHSRLRRLMCFLRECGVSPVHAGAIHRLYGDEAEALLRQDPYRLAEDLSERGFPVADAIARALGQNENDPRRLTAALRYLVGRANAEGHVWCSRQELLAAAGQHFAIELADAENSLMQLVNSGDLVEETVAGEPDDSAVYPADLHAAEISIARSLAARLSVPAAPLFADSGQIAGRVLVALAIAPSAEQAEVLEACLGQPAAIVTGGPGTGKTTLVRAYAALMHAAGRRTTLAAPTGRAARRLAEVTGLPAATIHRLLGYNPMQDAFVHTADDPLDTDALIVDEASMIDTALMAALIEALPMSATLLLVGDARQLPSVGPGNVLSDLIGAGCLPVHELTEIFRQAAAGPIVVNAHRIRRGELPETASEEGRDAEFQFIEAPDPAAAAARIVDLCRRLPEEAGLNGWRDIQVLTPMHRGEAGTVSLNLVLQQALNPPSAASGARGVRFRPGDKVIHLKNNYTKDVFNGDIGTVAQLDDEAGGVAVAYDGRRVIYDREELDQLALAYAITVHKSQGSEYPVIVMPLLTQHYPMLQRNLLYTAVTRGRRRVVLVGSRKALAIAVGNERPDRRRTGLRRRLAAACEMTGGG